MALTAMFILRFDVSPLQEPWQIPRQKQESMATNVFRPKDDIQVEIKQRQGHEGGRWSFEMT